MVDRLYDGGTVYTDPEDFYRLEGNVNMFLSRSAAIRICQEAAERNIFIVGYDGGISRPGGGCEVRLDCNCSRKFDPPVSKEEAHESNMSVVECLKEEPEAYDTYLITARYIDGSKLMTARLRTLMQQGQA